MKTNRITAFALLVQLILVSQPAACFAQGTAFTYQGRLSESGAPASGIYDLQFTIYDSSDGSNLVSGPLTNPAVPVSGGLFTTALDFGGGVFTGADRWLEIAARTNGGGAFVLLTPRQKLAATPYAITAGNVIPAALVGIFTNAVTFNNASNVFVGDGSGLTQVNASTLGSLSHSNFWKTAGNAGTTAGADFLGTTDPQPVELKVNSQRVARWERNTNAAIFGVVIPNIISGHEGNVVASGVGGATIAGGGGPEWYGPTPPQTVSAPLGTIGGGVGNTVHASVGTIGGGERGVIASNAANAFIGGGAVNFIDAWDATIGGGRFNTIQNNAHGGVIVGGNNNIIGSGMAYSTLGGGTHNRIGAARSVIGIGAGDINTISGGGGNHIGQGAAGCLIAGGENNSIETNVLWGSIGAGLDNAIGSGMRYAVIDGGFQNRIGGVPAFTPSINVGDANVIAGGSGNHITSPATANFIGSGQNNAILSGIMNYSTIGGGRFNRIGANQNLVGIDFGEANGITAGAGNHIAHGAAGSIIAGGQNHSVGANVAWATISGGFSNSVADGAWSSTICGGDQNTIRTNALCATIVGGSNNVVAGNFSLAAGNNCTVQHPGCFMWSDGTLPFGTGISNAFYALASGGFYLFSGNSVGVQVAPGGNAWSPVSDRNVKENFESVDCSAVLEKVAALPLTTWNLKTQSPEIRHIGVMAQDFKAAFQVGEDERHISTSDADGVTLAAIQGLNQKLAHELKRRDAENAVLRQRLERLEQLVAEYNGGAE